jgi:hypothetical protein
LPAAGGSTENCSTSAFIQRRFLPATPVYGEKCSRSRIRPWCSRPSIRIEGHRPAEPERSLYNRVRVPATLDDGRTQDVWVYFYNAPLGRAPRITSGDYVEHLKSR